jgi:hypothetical protein
LTDSPGGPKWREARDAGEVPSTSSPWFPPGSQELTARGRSTSFPRESQPITADGEPQPHGTEPTLYASTGVVPDIFTLSSPVAHVAGPKRSRRIPALVGVFAACVGVSVAWFALSGPGTAVAPSATQELSTAAARTIDARSYTADESISLGISPSGGAAPGLPLAGGTVVFQAPDRVRENIPVNLFTRATVVEIGKDCWTYGIPESDLTSGDVSCSSLVTPSGFEPLLQLLSHVASASARGHGLVYTPADPTEFLTQSGIQTSMVPGANLVVKVSATTRGQYLGTVTVVVTQSGDSADGHVATESSFTISFSSVGTSAVARPSGPPTEVGGVFPPPTFPRGPETQSERLLDSAVTRTASESGFVLTLGLNVNLGGARSFLHLSETETYQAPNRTVVHTAQAGPAGSSQVTVTQVGNDCWYVGVSASDAGSSACKPGGAQLSALGPLRVLRSATGVSCRASICTFNARTPETFLADAGVSYSPFGGWGLPVTLVVQVKIRAGLVVGEQMTATQTTGGSKPKTLSVGVFRYEYAQFGTAPPVLQPSSAPNAIASG